MAEGGSRVDGEAKQSVVEPPRGTYPASVDEKGRLKLPVVFQQYLNSLGEKVFITSLDLRTIRIYPLSIWKQNESLFDQEQGDPQLVADMSFIANALGADAEMDSQGRVSIHTDLRRRLQIEKQQVYLDCLKGRINVYSEAIYQERMKRAETDLEAKLKALEMRGLK